MKHPARRTLLASIAALTMLTTSVAFAVSKEPIDPEKAAAVRSAPPSRLLPPPPAPVTTVPKQPLADTSALLPGGQYVLAITLRNETHEDTAKITRNGADVIASLSGGAELRGTLAADGHLQLQGTGNNNALQLTGSVANRRASGQARLARGAQNMNGSFALDPQTGARKLAQYGEPKKGSGAECGFFCRVGKAWDCLSNWTKC